MPLRYQSVSVSRGSSLKPAATVGYWDRTDRAAGAEPVAALDALETARAIPASIAAATRRCSPVSSDLPLNRTMGGAWVSRYELQPSRAVMTLAASRSR